MVKNLLLVSLIFVFIIFYDSTGHAANSRYAPEWYETPSVFYKDYGSDILIGVGRGKNSSVGLAEAEAKALRQIAQEMGVLVNNMSESYESAEGKDYFVRNITSLISTSTTIRGAKNVAKYIAKDGTVYVAYVVNKDNTIPVIETDDISDELQSEKTFRDIPEWYQYRRILYKNYGSDVLIGVGCGANSSVKLAEVEAKVAALKQISEELGVVFSELVNDFQEAKGYDPAGVFAKADMTTTIRKNISITTIKGAKNVAKYIAKDGTVYVAYVINEDDALKYTVDDRQRSKSIVKDGAVYAINEDSVSIFRSYNSNERQSEKTFRDFEDVPEWYINRGLLFKEYGIDVLIGTGMARLNSLILSEAVATAIAQSEIAQEINAMVQSMQYESERDSSIDTEGTIIVGGRVVKKYIASDGTVYVAVIVDGF